MGKSLINLSLSLLSNFQAQHFFVVCTGYSDRHIHCRTVFKWFFFTVMQSMFIFFLWFLNCKSYLLSSIFSTAQNSGSLNTSKMNATWTSRRNSFLSEMMPAWTKMIIRQAAFCALIFVNYIIIIHCSQLIHLKMSV